MSGWSEVIGQDELVAQLSEIAAHPQGAQMTHAWLFTGPPGSGRSVMARAMAQALVCEHHTACGECKGCKLVLAGTHPDVSVLNTDKVTIAVADVRDLVSAAQLSPAMGGYRVQIIEDADRMTEYTSNVLLKALEEPPERTIWMLCAPSEMDLLPTIRSRTRMVRLVAPSAEAVAELLTSKYHVDAELALRSARETQHHVGMAKRLATDPSVRERRNQSIETILGITSPSDAVRAAETLLEIAKADSEHVDEDNEESRRVEMLRQLGLGPNDKIPVGYKSQLKQDSADVKRRQKRSDLDGIDRILTDMATVVRDALLIGMDVDAELINESKRAAITDFARRVPPERALVCLDAITAARARLGQNVQPKVVLEGLLVEFTEAFL